MKNNKGTASERLITELMHFSASLEDSRLKHEVQLANKLWCRTTPETRNLKHETRNPKPKTRNSKPGSRNSEPETGSFSVLGFGDRI